jgi:hypothetical protein
VFDQCNLLLLASADKEHVPTALRQTLGVTMLVVCLLCLRTADTLGVLLVREASRTEAVRAATTPVPGGGNNGTAKQTTVSGMLVACRVTSC